MAIDVYRLFSQELGSERVLHDDHALDVYSRDETTTDDGLRQTSIEARYLAK